MLVVSDAVNIRHFPIGPSGVRALFGRGVHIPFTWATVTLHQNFTSSEEWRDLEGGFRLLIKDTTGRPFGSCA